MPAALISSFVNVQPLSSVTWFSGRPKTAPCLMNVATQALVTEARGWRVGARVRLAEKWAEVEAGVVDASSKTTLAVISQRWNCGQKAQSAGGGPCATRLGKVEQLMEKASQEEDSENWAASVSAQDTSH